MCVRASEREAEHERGRESMSAHWIMQIRVKCFTRGRLGVRFRRGWKTCLSGHTQHRSLCPLAQSRVERNWWFPRLCNLGEVRGNHPLLSQTHRTEEGADLLQGDRCHMGSGRRADRSRCVSGLFRSLRSPAVTSAHLRRFRR